MKAVKPRNGVLNMSAIARAHGAARCLLGMASVGFFSAAAASDSATPSPSAEASQPNEYFAIALAMQSPALPSATVSALPRPPTTVVAQQNASIQFASVNLVATKM